MKFKMLYFFCCNNYIHHPKLYKTAISCLVSQHKSLYIFVSYHDNLNMLVLFYIVHLVCELYVQL